MEVIRAPWRIDYINANKDSDSENACIFCLYPTQNEDADNLIIARGETCFAMLNKFPYSNGHILIAPYRHTSNITSLSDPEKLELMSFSQYAVNALKTVMDPGGFNLGINLGKIAGAGIDQHMHLHVVPRWNGDTNFMSVTAETKVLPEALSATQTKLANAWQSTNHTVS
ncbi:MAG: HIT domain-containing protein [Synergistaceae bacterium]|jgi:ATP adenylyltransferase|nr:HIT domain-containing protein [Synergistaceae bacterium]